MFLRGVLAVLLIVLAVLLSVVTTDAIDVDVHVLSSLIFSPASLSFASTEVGVTSASQAIAVTNVSAYSLNITSVFVTGTGGNEFFVVGPGCAGSVAPAGTCQINVVFRPVLAGTQNAVVKVVAASPGHSYTVAVSGTGTNPLDIVFSPPSPVTVACSALANAVVSTVSVTGGNGNPVSLVFSGQTADFFLSRTTPPANIQVAAGGIPMADCSTTAVVTVTADQP